MPKVHLLHIGKTGGSTIKSTLNKKNIKLQNQCYTVDTSAHTKTLGIVPGCYAFFIRDPVRRYVSGFISRLREDKPLYYAKHSPAEQIAFKNFKSPNQLAEALTSSDAKMRQQAVFAMKNISHTRMDLKYYMGGKENLIKNLDRIMFVGRMEYLDKDFQTFLDILGMSKVELLKDEVNTHKTPIQFKYIKRLSPLAVKNILAWYKEDYEIINILINKKFVSEDYRTLLTTDGDYKEEVKV